MDPQDLQSFDRDREEAVFCGALNRALIRLLPRWTPFCPRYDCWLRGTMAIQIQMTKLLISSNFQTFSRVPHVSIKV
jgi:hypothetical protein